MRRESPHPPRRTSEQATTEPERPTFEAIYETEARWVWSTLRRLGVLRDSCADAMQEVFMVVHRRLPEYEPRHRLRGWLGAIAVRVAKRFQRREALTVEIIDDEQTAVPDAELGLDLARETEDADELQQVLDKLTPDQRFLLLSHHRDEVPVAEIAEHLDVPEGTVKKRLSLARKAFRAAWRRLKACDRHAGASVLPIFGPLTLLEADREPPPLPDGVHQKVWSGIQQALQRGGGGGGEGDGGGGSTPEVGPAAVSGASATAGTVAVKAGTLAALAASGAFVAGVIAGALWDPFHRLPAPPVAATFRPDLVIRVPQLGPATTASAAPMSEQSTGAPAAAPTIVPSTYGEASDVEDLMMDKAIAALAAGKPAAALAQLQQHATHFHGGGKRAQQREALWISALLCAGRKSEARDRLATFERAYPNSPRLEEFRTAITSP
jgi:RNA polymerase sigma factor (sigma-70 family)